MKKKNEMKTKKCLAAIGMAILSVGMLTGCGEKGALVVDGTEEDVMEAISDITEGKAETDEAESDAQDEEAAVEGDQEVPFDAPSNEFEDRVGKTVFESYDEIIGLLQKDEAYAKVQVKGYEGDVLLITSYTYEFSEGTLATTECSMYTTKPDGTVTYDSVAVGGGTATPVAMDADGVIYAANHMGVDKLCYGVNSIGSVGVMNLESVLAEELDDNGDPTSVIGFKRTSNSVVDDSNLEDIASDDVDAYKQIFADYEKATPINFTVVE